MEKTPSFPPVSRAGRLHFGLFADGVWAQNFLKKALSDDTLAVDFVCLRNDKPDETLRRLAENSGIDVLRDGHINGAGFLEKLRGYGSDLFVSLFFDQIFRETLIHMPPLKTINCHAGKLPFYRGRSVLNWALINDEKEFGITVHYMDEGIDTGDIILQRTFPISDEDNYRTLRERAYLECPKILYDAIKQIQAGSVKVTRQKDIHPLGSYCGARGENDEIVNWNQTSREIFCFIRALTEPGPCACSFVNGERIRLFSAREMPGAPAYKGIPGQVLMKTEEGAVVKTGDSYILLTAYEGKLRAGDRLGSKH